jgi:L-lactate dehydrogenase complex protein LldG
MSGGETGSRTLFMARLRGRLGVGAPENVAHPLPPMPVSGVPSPDFVLLDRDDLVGTFVRAATVASAVVHRVVGSSVPESLVADVCATYGVRTAVVSAEPEAQAVGSSLAAAGVQVSGLSIDSAADADLGVTSATAGLALTGSLVVESAAAGGRSASLLPPVHLCVLPASRIVAAVGDVLRGLGAPGRIPSNVVCISGPSRSGDIEQIITLGVHGPTSVVVVVLE